MSESKETVEQAAERLGWRLLDYQERSEASIHYIQSLEAEVAKLRKRLDWMCSECRTVFQAEDLHKGPRCVLCPDCGKASIHTLDELRCIEAEAEVTKLKAEIHEVSRERHDAEEQAASWRRVAEKLEGEKVEARADLVEALRLLETPATSTMHPEHEEPACWRCHNEAEHNEECPAGKLLAKHRQQAGEESDE